MQDYIRVFFEWGYTFMTMKTVYEEVYQWYTAVKQDHTKSMLGQAFTGWNACKKLIVLSTLPVATNPPYATVNMK